jgi:NAD(P)-dependent dehydrogenase (short-subunit alcohol dehydrogenase family)
VNRTDEDSVSTRPPGPRTSLVTGASSGIGRAIAEALARRGDRVALLARRRERLEEVAATLPPASDGTAHLVLPADLTDPEAIAAAIATVRAQFGGLDLLVNDAGMGYRALVTELEPDLVRRVFATNVEGLLHMCRLAHPLLAASSSPVVVNVASVVGRRGIPGQSVYAASKAAVCSIGEALRLEWAADGIRVCTLNPALTTTGFFDAQPNPAGLPDPDLSASATPESVALEVLALDERPRPERSLRWKWWLLGALTPIFPHLSDRLTVKRLGGGWRVPRW